MIILRALWCGAVLSMLSLTACESASSGTPTSYEGEGPMRVTCTVGMLGDVVRSIGGDRIRLETLMGPGTDPHLYRTVPSDRKKLERSDLVLYCGHHLEGNMGPTFERFGRKVRTVAVCERIPPERLLADADHPENFDPHLWFDVELWSEVAQVVCDELCQFDPAGAEGYRERAREYRARLSELDADVAKRVVEIPAERRVMITAHDAFRYFGRKYGVEVLGIQGLSTADEAGIRRINELVDTIVRRKIRAVFVESTIAEDNVQALVEGCRSRGHRLAIGGELYSDAMGPAETPEGTYLGMIRHNVDTLVHALR